MQNLNSNTVPSTKKTWSDPQLTILSVKSDTLGGGAAAGDATTLS